VKVPLADVVQKAKTDFQIAILLNLI